MMAKCKKIEEIKNKNKSFGLYKNAEYVKDIGIKNQYELIKNKHGDLIHERITSYWTMDSR